MFRTSKSSKMVILTVFIFFVLYTINSEAKSNYKIPYGSARSELDNDAVRYLKKQEEAFRAIIKKASPAVVFISISKSISVPDYPFLDPFEEFFFGFRNHRRHRRAPQKKYEQKGVGSGFVIDSKKGYIITNNHVVGEADTITVKTHAGKTYNAKVIGTDANTDIAIIQAKDLPSSLGQIYFADSNKIAVGDWAIAIGAPHGLAQSITRGIVSAKGRGSLNLTGYGDFIQTDAAINPGNSGGPLLNSSGNAIGMNTAIFSKSGGSQGIGFAIPANILRNVAEKLINDGKVQRAYLGVGIQDLDQELARKLDLKITKGVLITSVEEGTPADDAGLRAEDVIVEVEGKEISGADQLRYVIGLSPLDKKVNIVFYRNGRKKNVKVYLTPYSSGEGRDKLGSTQGGWGMSLKENSRKLRREFDLNIHGGLVVTKVEYGSAAYKAGIKEGDVIIAVERKEVGSVRSFRKLVKKKDKILLRVARGNYHLFFVLTK